jgi:hypothetical protein
MSEGEHRPDRTPLVAADQVEWHQTDLTATIGADVRWSDLNDHHLGTLSPGHLVIPQWLPIDCDGDPSASIGKLVERNSTGPLRIGYGGWRDLMLGCQFRNGRGELISAGGRTVKNVAGYDLTKFMIGQSGVFGKVVTITTRLHRRPEDGCRAEFAVDLTMINRLLASPCKPQWTMLTPSNLICGYLGDKRTIDFYLEQLPEWNPTRIERTSFSADQAWRCEHWRRGTMRASVPPARILEFVKFAAISDWVAEAVFGVVIANVAYTAKVQTAAASVGGRAWFFDSSDRVMFAPSPQEKVVLDRLKSAMDPDRALAPLPW